MAWSVEKWWSRYKHRWNNGWWMVKRKGRGEKTEPEDKRENNGGRVKWKWANIRGFHSWRMVPPPASRKMKECGCLENGVESFYETTANLSFFFFSSFFHYFSLFSFTLCFLCHPSFLFLFSFFLMLLFFLTPHISLLILLHFLILLSFFSPPSHSSLLLHPLLLFFLRFLFVFIFFSLQS